MNQLNKLAELRKNGFLTWEQFNEKWELEVKRLREKGELDE